MAAGLKTIIALSFVLAIGFLLVILSSALWHNYLPLLVVATYVVAPLPNWICGRCANPDDFMENAGSAIVDFGRFVTGFLVVMGIGMLQSFSAVTLLVIKTNEHAAEQKESSGSVCVHLLTRNALSPPSAPCALRSYSIPGNDNVYYRRPVDIRDDHKLHNVLPGRAGLLSSVL
ncbi:Vacuolar protein sorting-associated protein 55 [Lambiella insularis]|nr:Vacuolar protein sorting-associated protein 55 [Lambiella insularis]